MQRLHHPGLTKALPHHHGLLGVAPVRWQHASADRDGHARLRSPVLATVVPVLRRAAAVQQPEPLQPTAVAIFRHQGIFPEAAARTLRVPSLVSLKYGTDNL